MNHFDLIKNFMLSCEGKVLFGLGGLGDFFVCVNACKIHKLPLIFQHNNHHDIFQVNDFCKLLEVPSYIYDPEVKLGSAKSFNDLKVICNSIIGNRGVACYNNMAHEFPKVSFNPVPGLYNFCLDDNYSMPDNFFIICPSGGILHPEEKRQFYQEEVNKILDLAKKIKIVPIFCCSKEQYQLYDRDGKNNLLTLTSFNNEKISPKTFFKFILKSKYVISPDTMLKTVGGITCKKTFMIKNRNKHDKFHNYGTQRWDHVFTNPAIWPTIKMMSFEEIVDYMLNFNSRLKTFL